MTGHSFSNLNWGDIAANSFGSALADQVVGEIQKADQKKALSLVQEAEHASETKTNNTQAATSYGFGGASNVGLYGIVPESLKPPSYVIPARGTLSGAAQHFIDVLGLEGVSKNAIIAYLTAENKLKYDGVGNPIVHKGQKIIFKPEDLESSDAIKHYTKEGSKLMRAINHNLKIRAEYNASVAAANKSNQQQTTLSGWDIIFGQTQPNGIDNISLEKAAIKNMDYVLNSGRSYTASENLPAPTDLYLRRVGWFESSYGQALRNGNAADNLFDKVVYGTFQTGLLIPAVIDTMVSNGYNSLNNINVSMQYSERYSLTGNINDFDAALAYGTSGALDGMMVGGLAFASGKMLMGRVAALPSSASSPLTAQRGSVGVKTSIVAEGGEAGVTLYSQAHTLKAMGVSKENRRAFLNGETVQFQYPTTGGHDVYGFLQLNDGQLTSQLFSINNVTGGAPAAFRKFVSDSQSLSRSFGLTQIELQGGSVINSDLAKALSSRGFQPKTVPVPHALGGGLQEVLFKIVPVKQR